MNEYKFSIIINNVKFSPESVDSIYDNGCHDAIINYNNKTKKMCLHFTREADSMQEAINSAEEALLGAGFDDILIMDNN